MTNDELICRLNAMIAEKYPGHAKPFRDDRKPFLFELELEKPPPLSRRLFQILYSGNQADITYVDANGVWTNWGELIVDLNDPNSVDIIFKTIDEWLAMP